MNTNNTPNTLEDLRQELLEAYTWVKQDPRRANQVKEMVNAAGKVIASLKIELEYAALRGSRPEIPFLNRTKEITLKSGKDVSQAA